MYCDRCHQNFEGSVHRHNRMYHNERSSGFNVRLRNAELQPLQANQVHDLQSLDRNQIRDILVFELTERYNRFSTNMRLLNVPLRFLRKMFIHTSKKPPILAYSACSPLLSMMANVPDVPAALVSTSEVIYTRKSVLVCIDSIYFVSRFIINFKKCSMYFIDFISQAQSAQLIKCDYCNAMVQPSKIHEHFCALHPGDAYNRYLQELISALQQTFDRFQIILDNIPLFTYTVQKNLLLVNLDFQNDLSEQIELTMHSADTARVDQTLRDPGVIGSANVANVPDYSYNAQSDRDEQTMRPAGAACLQLMQELSKVRVFDHSAQSEQTIGPAGSVIFDSIEKESIPRIPKKLADYDRLKLIGSVSEFCRLYHHFFK